MPETLGHRVQVQRVPTRRDGALMRGFDLHHLSDFIGCPQPVRRALQCMTHEDPVRVEGTDAIPRATQVRQLVNLANDVQCHGACAYAVDSRCTT